MDATDTHGRVEAAKVDEQNKPFGFLSVSVRRIRECSCPNVVLVVFFMRSVPTSGFHGVSTVRAMGLRMTVTIGAGTAPRQRFPCVRISPVRNKARQLLDLYCN